MDTEKLPVIGRIVALFEVVLCSDFPTQLTISQTLIALHVRPLSLRFVVVLSLVDTVALLALIVLFLRTHRERVRDVMLGSRPILREVQLGIPLTVGAFVLAIAALAVLRLTVPSLHNVEENPLQALIHGRRDALLFALVVVIAGGVREEIQRAFILHRFDVWLGGRTVGLLVSSAAFGLGHVLQGRDVIVTTALLGCYWGVVYLRRRSVVAPMVSHAGFNLVELTQFFVGR